MRRRFADDFPITSLILMLMGGLFIIEVLATRRFAQGDWELTLMMWIDGRASAALGSMIPNLAFRGEVWRLVTPIFLHGMLPHLFMNAYVLWDIGRFCEAQLSSTKFFTIFILCGIGGSVGTTVSCWIQYSGLPPWYQSVGASGAIFGLIGVVLVYSIKEKHRELRQGLIRWIVIMAVLSFFIPNIDHGGHIGGFVTGCLLGLTVKDYTTSTTAERWRIPSYITGAVVAASLGIALYRYFISTR